MQRVPRRWIDRLMSLFVSRRRYQCLAFGCGWEGGLRRRSAREPGASDDQAYRRGTVGASDL